MRTAVVSPADTPEQSDGALRAGYAASAALTVMLALDACVLLASAVLLIVHPDLTGLRAFAAVVNQQNQSGKTVVYLLSFFVILPLALVGSPRVADKIASGPNRGSLNGLVVGLGVSLGGVIVLTRLSASLPWGDGLGVLLAGFAAWGAVAVAVLRRALAPRPWPALARLDGLRARAAVVCTTTLLAVVLCFTNLRALNAAVLAVGMLGVLAVVLLTDKLTFAGPRRGLGTAVDVVVVVLLLLAIPDTVIFRTSSAIPNSFFEPGIVQFQQDWILGPANQLLGGGALLVNVPVSQYGVGMLYFLSAWFHIAPIGYGTFGFLDGVLTAMFYAAGYGVLRLASVPRVAAIAAMAVAVVALIYDMRYPVGALPEQGPLRFGLPIALIVPLVATTRWPRHARAWRGVALAVLGLSSIWALEAFAYTVITFIAMTAALVWLEHAGNRRRVAIRQALLGLGACVVAHVVLAIGTLIATGRLPVWSRYLAYLHALLLGGKEGSITYGFARWSPGLALGAACLASAAAIVLLAARVPELVKRERGAFVALAGTTAYSIAMFSYADNRSSTYLLLYIAMPMILAATLWVRLLMGLGAASAGARLGGLALALSLVVLMISAAWPSVGDRFLRSALAHAYPGGGLRAAVHRLWHPPPIDPRAPEGQRLLARYLPRERPLVVLPAAQDLAIEILMRSHRSNGFFIGDGYMDSFVPPAWKGVLDRQISRLAAGDRVLIDRTALRVLTALRERPFDPLTHPIGGGASQEEWILQEIERRFELRVVAADRQGFVVAELAPRHG